MATQINYGMSTVTPALDPNTTISDLLANRNVLSVLGASSDVRAMSGGEVIKGDELVADYSTLTLEKEGSSKA
jgi:hypothetical protein